MVENGQFVEFEMAEDVQEFVKFNKDVQIETKLKEKLKSFDGAVLLKVTKKIESPTQILSIEQIDEEYIKNNF
jgi:hypothetical protein